VIRLELPIPPSLNNAYVNIPGHGRVASHRLKRWKVEAGWEARCQRPGKISGPFRFAILLPASLKGDASNRIKIAEDLMVALQITPDDRHAISSMAEKSEAVPYGRCIVQIEEA